MFLLNIWWEAIREHFGYYIFRISLSYDSQEPMLMGDNKRLTALSDSLLLTHVFRLVQITLDISVYIHCFNSWTDIYCTLSKIHLLIYNEHWISFTHTADPICTLNKAWMKDWNYTVLFNWFVHRKKKTNTITSHL